jgi:HSP20 family protein
MLREREYARGGRWPDLFGEMRRAQSEMNRLFGGLRYSPQEEYPPMTVWVGTEGAIVTAAIPGVKSDGIEITVHQNTVSLSGQREPAVAEDDEAIVRRQEINYGPFSRTIMLPFRVNADQVSARFNRGILMLELPRPEDEKPRQIKVAAG